MACDAVQRVALDLPYNGGSLQPDSASVGPGNPHQAVPLVTIRRRSSDRIAAGGRPNEYAAVRKADLYRSREFFSGVDPALVS